MSTSDLPPIRRTACRAGAARCRTQGHLRDRAALAELAEKARTGRLNAARDAGRLTSRSQVSAASAGRPSRPSSTRRKLPFSACHASAMQPVYQRRQLRAAADAAAVAVLRSSGHRWRERRTLHELSCAKPRRAARPDRGGAVSRVDLVVPDIGDFEDVPVVDVLVQGRATVSRSTRR